MIGASANTENFDTTASAKKTTSPAMFAARQIAAGAPQEEQRPEHERREAHVGRDERGAGGDVRFDRVADERDDRRPETQPRAGPEKYEDAEADTDQHDHEPRRVEQSIAAVVEVEEFLAVRIERPGPAHGHRAFDGREIHVRADRQKRQRRPHAQQGRMLGIDAVVVARERRVPVHQVDRLVPHRGFLRVAGQLETDEDDREDGEHEHRVPTTGLARGGRRRVTRWWTRSFAP